MSSRVLIVGGGLAAASAAAGLREAGHTGEVVVLTEEPHLPYERPGLSKGFLTGELQPDELAAHPAEWYAEHGVEVRTGCRVDAVDTAAHTVTAGGERLRYDRLLLATGASPRHLPAADDSGAPVAYLRTIADSRRIRSFLRPGARIAIIGGGFLGLEVAASARTAGAEVTVLESLELPLLGVLGREVASTFADLHREHGVDLRVGARVTGIGTAAGGALLTLEDGAQVDADLLVVGIGARPQTDLAAAAGLRVDDGVVVDARLRTSNPDVFAAGDLARADHPRLGRSLRVEHWANARGQGRTAGLNMAGGDTAYSELPYFFTDQYDLGMEYVGAVPPGGYDEVVLRGDVAGRVFTALWVSDGRVVAAMHVNDWSASDTLREVVGQPV